MVTGTVEAPASSLSRDEIARLAAEPEPRPPAERHDLRRLLVRPMPTDRLAGWLGPLAVTLLAALLRFDRLGIPSSKIFDEVYYAKDSYDLLTHGVELNADGTGPSFVVHPPLGKWLIALGEGVAGNDAVGWRLSAAVVGTLAVLVLARTARRLTRSTLLGSIAGLLLALDGLALVQSRVSMLDIFLMFWVVAAFGCLVVDRDAGRARLATRLEAAGRPTGAGPALGLRWWRVGAGLCLGAAVATKWSGLYYVAALFVLAFAWDVGARRTAGVRRPVRSSARRDLGGLLLALLAVPTVVYVASWTGWFVTDQGWDRQWANDPANVSHWRIVPDAVANAMPGVVRSWVHYHWQIWNFHETLDTSHPYQSHPWGWLLLARPVAYYYSAPGRGELGCGVDSCSREVLGTGTPAIWWAGLLAVVYCGWRWVTTRDWRAGALVVLVLAGIAPWVREDLRDRTMFLFYALPALPFLVLAVTLTLGWALGGRDASPARRRWGAAAVGAYLLLVVLDTVWLLPVLTAQTLPHSAWLARMLFQHCQPHPSFCWI